MPVRFYFTLIARSRTHQHHADSSIAAHLRHADRKEHIESRQNVVAPRRLTACQHTENQAQRILFTKNLAKILQI